MKKIFLILLSCLMALGLLASCGTAQEEDTQSELLRKIREDDAVLEGVSDEEAGGMWIERYSDMLGFHQALTVDEIMRTSELSDGFDMCFSRWRETAEKSYIVTEYVYPDGTRHLADISRAADVTQRLSHALETVSDDPRVQGRVHDGLKNTFDGSVTEFDITKAVPYTSRYDMLGRESLKNGDLRYGQSEDGRFYRLRVTAQIDKRNGIVNPKSQSVNSDVSSKGVNLVNSSYHLGYDKENADLLIYNRNLETQIVYQASEGKLPTVFDVYDDRAAVYTVGDGEGNITGYGIYGIYAVNGTTVHRNVYFDGQRPVMLIGSRLYSVTEGTEEARLRVKDLSDPDSQPADVCAAPAGEVLSAGADESGARNVWLCDLGGGKVGVSVKDTATDAVLFSTEIYAPSCKNGYIGFLDDDTLVFLDEGKFMCNDYLFLIDIRGKQ